MNKLPLLAFALIAALSLAALLSGRDPAIVTSPLIGKPAPGMEHETALVNFFASWCVECVGEVPVLKQSKIPVIGIAYKDDPEKLKAWLKKHGNPYAKIIHDKDGGIALDWGVTGVPESFVVENGVIKKKITGAYTP